MVLLTKVLVALARALQVTIYTDKLPPAAGGAANAFVVRIRPKYRGDAGIHAHEAVHVAQFWAVSALACVALSVACHLAQQPPVYAVLGFATHSLLYALVPAYRLWAEVQAYSEQLRHYPDDRTELFAEYIAQGYRLDISPAQATDQLRRASNA
ncbi:MAG: hypothetical protein Q8R67_12100 [Rhodoferax sp.]|nr:hypothetical protein [Rhodoferax sp.]MDP3652414.1 hypothetical protein [Rhodoferax sp.]